MQAHSQRVLRLGANVDSRLAAFAGRSTMPDKIAGLSPRLVETPVGPVRVVDSESQGPCVLIVPDGPCVIEHYATLIGRLSSELRVICVDMPGFGFSLPRADYVHSLEQGATALLGVIDSLHIPRATLACSCANGFYALRAAQLAPQRVASLFLCQTPSLAAMLAWTMRTIPGPLRVPVLGQTAAFLSRSKLAMRWYAMSLPRGTAREPFRAPARAALNDGACFSLAGVVQGLLADADVPLSGLSLPVSMLWGAKDRTHQQTDPESLHALVPGAQIERCAELGHFPDLEDQANYARRLLAHLALHG